MVKRYDCYYGEDCEGGNSVTYDDYAELRALCEELGKAIKMVNATFRTTGAELGLMNLERKYDQWRRDNED